MLVGNDVVDLRDSDADPTTHPPRFDSRVFVEAELLALAADPQPNRLRWCLWAAKEAAYKVARKLDPLAVFSPRRFVVLTDSLLAIGSGETRVAWEGQRMAVTLFEDDAAVHAVATSEASRGLRTFFGVRRLSGRPDAAELSGAARGFARERLAPELGVAPHELQVRCEGRIPRLWLRGRCADLDLSLSHHGSVVAFAAAGRGSGD